MSSADETQCTAQTESGGQCSRPAQEDGYCYQHGPDDETADETDKNNESDQTSGTRDRTTMSDENNGTASLDEVRDEVQHTAEGILGYPLDGVTSITHDEEDWRVAVEVVERKSVPDTQDILGRYEIRLDDALTVTGYERTHRYRRDDMEHNV